LSKSDVNIASWKGWWVCSLAAMFYAYEYLLRIEPSVMEHALRQHFHLSASGLGWLLATYFYAYTPLQLVVGIVLDRFGCHKVLTLALIACVGGCCLFATGESLWLMVFGRWLLGAGSAFAFIGILRLGALWLPAHQFSFYVGMTTALGMVGAIFGDMVVAHLVATLNWSPVLFLSAFLGLVMVPFFIINVREPKIRHNKQKETLTFAAVEKFLFSPSFWALGFVACALFASLTVVAGVWGVPWLQVKYSHNTVWATHEIAAIFAGWLIGSPLIGWASSKLRSRKKLLMLGITGAIVCFSLLLLDIRYSDAVLWLLLFSYGLCCSAQVLCFAVVSDWVSMTAIATALALMNFMVMLSGMLLQPFVGQLLSFGWTGGMSAGLRTYSQHDFTVSMSVILCCLVVALFFMSKIPESFGRKTQRARSERR
jgi:MFS family permease